MMWRYKGITQILFKVLISGDGVRYITNTISIVYILHKSTIPSNTILSHPNYLCSLYRFIPRSQTRSEQLNPCPIRRRLQRMSSSGLAGGRLVLPPVGWSLACSLITLYTEEEVRSCRQWRMARELCGVDVEYYLLLSW